MKLTHSESRLLKRIMAAGGMLGSEIDKEVYQGFVLRKLMKSGLIHQNTLGMYIETQRRSEWTNARCEYDEFNNWMNNDDSI